MPDALPDSFYVFGLQVSVEERDSKHVLSISNRKEKLIFHEDRDPLFLKAKAAVLAGMIREAVDQTISERI